MRMKLTILGHFCIVGAHRVFEEFGREKCAHSCVQSGGPFPGRKGKNAMFECSCLCRMQCWTLGNELKVLATQVATDDCPAEDPWSKAIFGVQPVL